MENSNLNVTSEHGQQSLKRHFGVGILMRATTLHNDVINITLPAGTIVSFIGWRNGVPTIVFKDVDVRCEWHDGYWYAIAYGKEMLIKFPKGGICYPFLYFKNLPVKNA
jgi:hypothetical protein